MKALVIENEWEVPGEIRGFVKDNPQLFQEDEVNYQTSCRTRAPASLAKDIMEAEAIIVMSTFLYKDQLEEFVKAFAGGALGKKKFYIYSVMPKLYDWCTEKSYMNNFEGKQQFIANLAAMVSLQEVYEWNSNRFPRDGKPKVTDEFWDGCSMSFAKWEEKERGVYTVRRILWSEEKKMFYHEGLSPEKTIEDEGYTFNDPGAE